jgi:trans-2,3-dihydro-3-hydroxyanthranilate isomerase
VALGVFVFAPTPTGAYSRMFAPRAGVAEDPATGSATGPLGAYLARHGFIPLRDGERFTSMQGVHMGRPSTLHAILRVRDGTLETVEVGGSAVQLVVATMTLPSSIFPAHGSPDLRHSEVR